MLSIFFLGGAFISKMLLLEGHLPGSERSLDHLRYVTWENGQVGDYSFACQHGCCCIVRTPVTLIGMGGGGDAALPSKVFCECCT